MSAKSFPRVFSRDGFPPLSRHRLRLPSFREQSVNTSTETGRSNGESLRSRGTFLGWTGCYFSVQSPRRFSLSFYLSLSPFYLSSHSSLSLPFLVRRAEISVATLWSCFPFLPLHHEESFPAAQPAYLDRGWNNVKPERRKIGGGGGRERQRDKFKGESRVLG